MYGLPSWLGIRIDTTFSYLFFHTTNFIIKNKPMNSVPQTLYPRNSQSEHLALSSPWQSHFHQLNCVGVARPRGTKVLGSKLSWWPLYERGSPREQHQQDDGKGSKSLWLIYWSVIDASKQCQETDDLNVTYIGGLLLGIGWRDLVAHQFPIWNT